MKIYALIFLPLILLNCKKQPDKIIGTWKMVHAEVLENDSLKIKDLSQTRFIKIINDTHFAFFNQQNNGNEKFYGGGGTYTFDGSNYTETLNFTSVESMKDHEFSFKIHIKEDSLIQTGLEHVKEAGINREITEKYIRIH
ncbi:hypothetical protein VOI54_06605 [Tamlana sp. 2201CG12-4]|uniref:hypothetical protein n=1 Tax=Tamlana sp. 2201CG12-4 TaxID=3112582 RepID=UPI002DB7CA49|nr:hypothetical protein [Tamlana sp. 2201CG12-4]MEC3906682.1 hypothetical protein [Tamlana sp. 2201CG12-4]